MMTAYTDNGNKPRYDCSRMAIDYGEPRCQSLSGKRLDALVIKQVLTALQPGALEVSLKVAEDIEQERKNLLTNWNHQLERARYQVERTYRQYNAAEPENRLVARTLEKQWEEALLTEERLKKEFNDFLSKQPPALSAKEREEIRQLASDIPTLWSSPTTTDQERKEIVRLLIERVLVQVEGKTEKVLVEIHWIGGHITYADLKRPVAKFEQLSNYKELKHRAEKLRKNNKSLEEIAQILNQEGWQPAKKEAFNKGMVATLLDYRDATRKTRSSQIDRMQNEWTIWELSRKTSIPEPTLYQWLCKGLLKGRKCEISHKGVWLITANEQEIKRLQDLKSQPKAVHRLSIKRVE